MRPAKIVTANLDFGLRPKAVKQDLRHIIDDAEVLLLQEAKRVDIDRLIENPAWEVFQYVGEDDAKQGTAIAWRKGRIRAGKRGRTIGTRPHGRGLLTRYIIWTTLYVKDETGDEHPIIVASAHLPPKRFWGLIYNIMIRNILRFVKGRGKPVIIGADWNKLVRHANDLEWLERVANGKMYGFGIDGFLAMFKGQWKFDGMRQLPKNSKNGHHPIQIKVTPTFKKR